MIKLGKSKDLFLIHYKRRQRSSDWIYDKSNELCTKYLPPFLRDIFGIPYMVKSSNINILHIPEHHHSFIMPFFVNKAKVIVTIHDLVPILFTKTQLSRHPYNNFRFWWRWNFTFKLIRNRIDFVIADSENTKNDCIKHLKIPEEKIKVIYIAADEIYRPLDSTEEVKKEIKKYNINSQFILFVGTLESRKNIPNLIKAFYKLKNRGITHKLVITGKKGWNYAEIFKTVEKLNLQKDIIFTDYVPEEDLVKLYNAAEVFVYPSIYEGFGLPPLEAMSCGCPVITSNISSLPEVVGDAGITIDPYNIEELANKMYEVLINEDLRKELSTKGLERAKLFSWKKAAEETWQVYELLYNKNIK